MKADNNLVGKFNSYFIVAGGRQIAVRVRGVEQGVIEVLQSEKGKSSGKVFVVCYFLVLS